MGGTLQEILQRRGRKKEGLGQHLIHLSFYLLLGCLVALLYIGLTGWKTYLFLTLLIANLVGTSYSYFRRFYKDPAFGVLLCQVAMEALYLSTGEGLIHVAEIPLLISLLPKYSIKGIVLLLLLQLPLHLGEFFPWKGIRGPLFLFIIYISTAIPYIYLYNRERAVSRFRSLYEGLKRQAEELSHDRISEEVIIGGYMEYKNQILREIKNLLRILEEALVADMVRLFVPWEVEPLTGDGEADSGSVLIQKVDSPEGILKDVYEEKRPRILNLDSKISRAGLGFTPLDRASSILLCPVIDDSFCLGLLVAESCRFRAFDQQDLGVAERVASQIGLVIRRERVLAEMSLSQRGLRALHEESTKLVQTLELGDVIQRVIQSIERLSGGNALLLLREGRHYRVFGVKESEKWEIHKDALLEIAKSNRGPLYFEDLRDFKRPFTGLPLQGVRSLICFPFIQGSRIEGFAIVYSERPSAFSPYQVSLVEVFANHASESISRSMLHEQMKKRALTDGLTGLFNHRHFQERLEENVKRASRFGERLALLLLDIDHFKKINDTYGHPVGDLVLKRVASLIRSTVREVDIPARYGGEEFGIILIGASSKEAYRTASRLRKRIKAEKFSAQGMEFHITVSIGVATYPHDATTKDALIERADEALYTAKERGRDRIVLSEDICTPIS